MGEMIWLQAVSTRSSPQWASKPAKALGRTSTVLMVPTTKPSAMAMLDLPASLATIPIDSKVICKRVEHHAVGTESLFFTVAQGNFSAVKGLKLFGYPV